MTRAARVFAAFVLVCWVSWGSAARAEPKRRTAIALVVEGRGRELSRRFGAELQAIGWRVVETDPGSDVALAKLARRAGTLAVVRIGRDAEGIEVWVAPEVSAEASSEWIEVDAARPDLAVVRVVEALRARFLELGLEPEALLHTESERAAPATETAAPKPAAAPLASDAPRRKTPAGPMTARASNPSRAAEARVPSRLWLGGAGALVGSPGELGILPELELAARWESARGVTVGAEVWVPLGGATVEGSGGSAAARVWLAAATLDYRARSGRIFGSGGIACGASVLETEGEPAPGFVGQTARVAAFVPMLRAGFGLLIHRRLALVLDGSVGLAMPRSTVEFDGETVAFWGRPLFEGSLGFEWSAWE